MTRGLKGSISTLQASGSPGVTLIDPMTRGLKAIYRRGHSSLHCCYTDWPDDKGTESKMLNKPFCLFLVVTLIDPMTRGLKVACCTHRLHRLCVTLIDPMTRGLKGLVQTACALARGKLHWLTRWQGDWKSVRAGKSMTTVGYTDWPDDKGTESLFIALELIPMCQVTLIDPMTRGLKEV